MLIQQLNPSQLIPPCLLPAARLGTVITVRRDGLHRNRAVVAALREVRAAGACSGGQE
eukprot:SAG11_NODE_16398_length_548_cov_1.040089_2_plen_57_part_01